MINSKKTSDAIALETGDIKITGFFSDYITYLLIAWSLFQLYISSSLGSFLEANLGFGLINDLFARAIHLSFGGVLCFLLYPARKSKLSNRRVPIYDILLAFFILVACLWQAFYFAEIIGYNGRTRNFDFLFMKDFPFEFLIGWIAIFVILEAARRAVGIPLAIIGTIFVFYTVFNKYFPEPFGLSSVSFTRYVTTQWFGQEGVFGIPLGVSTKTIYLFVLFGAILHSSGAGRWFIDLAFAAVGHMRGGPAKSAVLASGFTGMISGSSIANTVTTGTFTIPIMKKNGYTDIKAGAIEVSASTNGQIMPPIMGAAAFVMAEVIGIPYFDIIKHAFIPAIISYIALFYIVHLEALKLGLKPTPILEAVSSVMRRGWYYLIPIAVLILMLTVFRFSPDRSALYCILTFVCILLLEKIILSKSRDILSIWSSVIDTKKIVSVGLMNGAKNMITVSIAVSAAGLVMGSIGASGLSNAIQELLTIIAGDSIIPILIATAILSIILGMGLPTTANYLIVSTLMVGIVSTLGRQAGFDFPIIAIHLFCFYFGLMADVTPPVGLAAYAASSISRADPIKTGVQAFWYDCRTAILPFVFIFNSELLLINVDSFAEGFLVFTMSLLAILAFTSVTQNWFILKMRFYESALLILACFILFRPGFFQERFFPEQSVNIDFEEFNLGIDDNLVRFTTIDLLDNQQVITFDKNQYNIELMNWSSLEITVMDSFLHEGAKQISISNFQSPAYKSGFRNGMNITSVERLEEGISKYWFYIPGVFIYLVVFFNQKFLRVPPKRELSDKFIQ